MKTEIAPTENASPKLAAIWAAKNMNSVRGLRDQTIFKIDELKIST